MSKLYIFGIGGTGSRVLRSLTMMMAAGVNLGRDIKEIVPIIIDPDRTNGDKMRTITLMRAYNKLRNQIDFSDQEDYAFFKTQIAAENNLALQNFTLNIKDTDEKRFGDFIEKESLSKENRALVEMLFSQKNLDSKMDVGFKGNPNIGCVVLNQIADSDDLKNIANSFDQGDRIFIISSIFGGTGASGFPLLLKTLRDADNATLSNKEALNNALIGGISVLPYFKLEYDENSEIESSTFMSKTKAALAYYQKNITDEINAFYFVADTPQQAYENNEGSTAQKNNAHMVEFLAASAIVDFCHRSKDDLEGMTHYYQMGTHRFSSALTMKSFYDETKARLYQPLTSFTLAANAVCYPPEAEKEIQGELNANKSLNLGSDFFTGEFYRHFKEFAEDYRGWLDEMKQNNPQLNLFNTATQNKPFELVSDIEAKKPTFLKRAFGKTDYSTFNELINKNAKGIDNSLSAPTKFIRLYSRGTKEMVKEKINF